MPLLISIELPLKEEKKAILISPSSLILETVKKAVSSDSSCRTINLIVLNSTLTYICKIGVIHK